MFRYLLATGVMAVGTCLGTTAPSAEEPRPRPMGTEVGQTEVITHEKLDLAGITRRGSLRLLVVDQGEHTQFLPRKDFPAVEHYAAAESLAKYLGVEAIRVEVSRYDQLIPALLDGRGDLIADALTITPERRAQVAFARAVSGVQEMVVGAKGDRESPRSIGELAGKTIYVRRSSAYAETLSKAQIPDLTIVPVDERIHTAEVVERVASGEWPLTVADAPIVAAVQSYEPRAVSLFPLTDGRALAWAVRPTSPNLRAAINRFQTERALTTELSPIFLGDLAAIRERGVLRVLTRNNPVTYFIYRGRPVGFEYELMRMLADELNVRLATLVAPDRASLIPWLREGKADLVAASLTVNEQRAEDVMFSRPYMFVHEVIVRRASAETPTTLESLSGAAVHVRRSSAYWRRSTVS